MSGTKKKQPKPRRGDWDVASVQQAGKIIKR